MRTTICVPKSYQFLKEVECWHVQFCPFRTTMTHRSCVALLPPFSYRLFQRHYYMTCKDCKRLSVGVGAGRHYLIQTLLKFCRHRKVFVNWKCQFMSFGSFWPTLASIEYTVMCQLFFECGNEARYIRHTCIVYISFLPQKCRLCQTSRNEKGILMFISRKWE